MLHGIFSTLTELFIAEHGVFVLQPLTAFRAEAILPSTLLPDGFPHRLSALKIAPIDGDTVTGFSDALGSSAYLRGRESDAMASHTSEFTSEFS